MIRKMVDVIFDGSGNHYIEAAGLSTDSKPTSGIITGSMIFEVDTGFRYAFDEVNHTWTKTEVTPSIVQDIVDDWLTAHPEATTTVQDGAITLVKLNSAAVATTAETTSYLNIT